MNLEIERKFLVKNNSFKEIAFKKKHIKQGFLNSDKERTVRVRIIEDKAYLTIKGKSNNTGTIRFEWEKEIPVIEAEQLMLLTEKTVIEKYRYYIKSKKHTFEVDEFLDENSDLIIAEVELADENESFSKPNWLGKEVTGEVKYYNSSLSRFPYKSWV
ncbi:MAG: CYTH domain-containing protein [Polaribacter sp.]|jgi:adenylate cyclase|nr:CYTH domain-containing protein [Polaribacter sp.]MDG1954918.1 CYTH domain-containing protein [Polaribacter sp.]MDG2074341.1 CYTH domain-containing protein [Polaribacter sp.]